MYAVVKIGTNQFKVSEGDVITVNRLKKPKGKSKDISLDKVLIIGDKKDIKIGQPFLKGAKVTAQIVGDLRGKKRLAFKYRRRKASSSMKGHRQELTSLNIVKISS